MVRVEQLYPLPTEQMLAILSKYPNARELRWLQEEPENMGAWNFIEHHTWRVKEQGYDLRHVARVDLPEIPHPEPAGNGCDAGRTVGSQVHRDAVGLRMI